MVTVPYPILRIYETSYSIGPVWTRVYTHERSNDHSEQARGRYGSSKTQVESKGVRFHARAGHFIDQVGLNSGKWAMVHLEVSERPVSPER